MSQNTAEQDLPPTDFPLPDGSFVHIPKVDVIFININYASNFRTVRTGNDESVEKAILQVAKHVARGLYKVVSLNASKHSCVVVISTKISRDDLMFKNGFPWDREDDPQPEVML